jgi:hypothetical protein
LQCEHISVHSGHCSLLNNTWYNVMDVFRLTDEVIRDPWSLKIYFIIWYGKASQSR